MSDGLTVTRLYKTGVTREDADGNEYILKRWVDFYYNEQGYGVKIVTSEGDVVNKEVDENGRIIYVESSDSDTITCSKKHFDVIRKGSVPMDRELEDIQEFLP